MVQEDHDRAPKKEALKKLREARRQTIAAVSARVQAQKKEVAAIKAELRQGERNVPEIAAATGLAPASVLWYLATLKKYGEIIEGGTQGSYFRYRLAANEGGMA